LKKNDSIKNVKSNIVTLQDHIIDQFCQYNHLSYDLRTFPLSKDEVECIKHISNNRACWTSKNSFMLYKNDCMSTFMVGEDDEYDVCDDSVQWIERVPSYLLFCRFPIPYNVTNKEDYFFKLVLFGRVN
jgi:hypothetical protein